MQTAAVTIVCPLAARRLDADGTDPVRQQLQVPLQAGLVVTGQPVSEETQHRRIEGCRAAQILDREIEVMHEAAHDACSIDLRIPSTLVTDAYSPLRCVMFFSASGLLRGPHLGCSIAFCRSMRTSTSIIPASSSTAAQPRQSRRRRPA